MIREDTLVDLLLEEDEVSVLQLLDLKTEDIVYRFLQRVRERRDYLEKYYNEEHEEGEEEFGIGVSIYPFKEELSFTEDDGRGWSGAYKRLEEGSE